LLEPLREGKKERLGHGQKREGDYVRFGGKRTEPKKGALRQHVCGPLKFQKEEGVKKNSAEREKWN